ncbi:MAG: PQQ-binding-like beta-propeller repeat protein [Proteobacteria bacterium]|nr:PQQ-binding-like beta-propeller repeat protein [Pseudomonadota bacterium]
MAKNKKPAARKTSAPPATPKPDAALLKSLQATIATVGVQRGTEDSPLLSNSGEKILWLLDIRAVALVPAALDAIATLFWQIYATQGPLQVGGMEVGAIPLVSAILIKAQQLGIATNGFIIRKARKPTGRTRIIEGNLNQHPVVLVDDLINSGASLEKCRAVLAHEGHTVAHAFAVVHFQNPQALAWAGQHGIRVTSLFTLNQFGLSLADAAPTLPPALHAYQPLWRVGAKGANPFYIVPKSAPLLFQDNILMGTDSGTFVAFNAHSGKPAWQFACPGTHGKGILSSPAVHNGKVYFGAYNGNVYCLDAASGKQQWVQQLCEWVGSSPLIVPQHNLLYIGLEYARPRAQGSIAAFRLDTGERVWEVFTKTYQHGSGVYFAAADLVIFGTNENTIAAHKAQSGEKVWEVPTRGPVKHAGAVDDARGLIVIGSFDGGIYVLDAATGAQRALIATAGVVYTTPLISGKFAFCGSNDQHLYVINLQTLTLEKKVPAGARVMAKPVPTGQGTLLFGTTGGRLLELNLATLQISGAATLPEGITNAAVVLPGATRVIVPSYMNELYAFARTTHPTGQTLANAPTPQEDSPAD